VGEVEKIHFKADTKFVVDDLKRGGISRLRRWMQDQGDSKAVYAYYFKAEDDRPVSEFLELLGGATEEDIMLTSSLPQPVYNRSYSGGGGGSIPAQVYDHDTGHFVSCKMSVKYEDAYYIEESRGEVRIEEFGFDSEGEWVQKYGTMLPVSYVSTMIEELIEMGYDLSDKNFYLVKPSVIRNSKLKERENWSDGCRILHDAAEQAMNDNLDDIRKVLTKPELADEASERWAEVVRMSKSDSEVKHVVSEYDDHVAEIEAVKGKVGKIRKFMHTFDLKVDVVEQAKTMDRFTKRYDKLMTKYPMLEEVGGYWMDEDTKQNCADYIDLVESK